MSDALADATVAPQSDALSEQTTPANPITNTVPADTAVSSIDSALDGALDKFLGDDDTKADKADAAPEKPAAKPAAEVKPKPEKSAAPEAVTPDDPVTEAKPLRQTAYKEPPSGFDTAAKAEWEAVPESVRGAMHRRAQEMEQGIEKYRTDAQEYEPVKRYAEMAKQSGTTLDQALGRYVEMENALRRDPMAGLQAVVANLGLTKQDGSPVTLRDVAASIMGQKPDQIASRQEATIANLTRQLQEVTQKIGGFQEHIEQQQYRAVETSANSAWQSFQEQNPRAAELEPDMATFLRKYPAPDNIPIIERLSDAYSWAVAKSPTGAHTAAPPLVQTQIAPKPNPAGQKSISGAPGGNAPLQRSRSTQSSLADDIETAMRRAGI
jgi:hypothetical protein